MAPTDPIAAGDPLSDPILPPSGQTSDVGRDQMVRVGERDIRVNVRLGTDHARPPLLMCCGIGASYEVLDKLVDALDPALTVVRFDVPGVGGTATPQLPYVMAQLARTSLQLMTALGFRRFDVLGYSWGGALAQQLAWQYRRRVRRMVLMCTGTGALMVPGSPRVLLRMLSPRRFRDPAYAAEVAAILYGGNTSRHSQTVNRLFSELEQPGRNRGYAYQLLAGATWTSLPFLPTIRQPTLVVSGDDDPIIPIINARILSAGLPRARMHLFHGGHIEPVVSPDLVAPQISEFLGRGLQREAPPTTP